MDVFDWIQIAILVIAVLILTPILGLYIAKFFEGTISIYPLEKLERISYRLAGINPLNEMYWGRYLKSLLLFNFAGFIFLFALLLLQGYLPLNPQGFKGVPWDLSFNIASSFATNTNWQSYAGETTLSYLTQAVGLTVQNFLSAATGMCALAVLVRGLLRKTSETVGNFWVDLVRSIIYILLPLSLLLAFFLVAQGVPQTFSPYVEVTTLENAKQIIPLGPVASQVAIKQIGSNGGGFFNANGSHPFENPNALTNFFELLAILIIPAATVFAYGIIIKSQKHAWLMFLVMGLLFALSLGISLYAEYLHNPVLEAYPVLEGKETRIGIVNSLLWAISTTSTSNGSVNAMISSLSPGSSGAAIFNILLGEVTFGGVGVGLASMIMYALLTVFLAGLMVGRTPEYLGKKIEKREMQWVMLAILMPSALILLGSSIAFSSKNAMQSLANTGPHGLTEVAYAFASSGGNNGSAFAGLNANTNFYNLTLGIIMILSRLASIVPSLALGGILAKKKVTPETVGTFSTETFLYAILLAAIILVVGGLAFFPMTALGPLVEHFLMLEGRFF